jgi:hypothetical protein
MSVHRPYAEVAARGVPCSDDLVTLSKGSKLQGAAHCSMSRRAHRTRRVNRCEPGGEGKPGHRCRCKSTCGRYPRYTTPCQRFIKTRRKRDDCLSREDFRIRHCRRGFRRLAQAWLKAVEVEGFHSDMIVEPYLLAVARTLDDA